MRNRTKSEILGELRENVARGARLLDRFIPDWHTRVGDEMIRGEFEMSDPRHCVLGSLELVEPDVLDPRMMEPDVALNGVRITSWGSEDAYRYGFNYHDSLENQWLLACADDGEEFGVSDLFRFMNSYWAAEVEQRKSDPVVA